MNISEYNHDQCEADDEVVAALFTERFCANIASEIVFNISMFTVEGKRELYIRLGKGNKKQYCKI